MGKFVDISSLQEDARIQLIGQEIMRRPVGQVIAILVDGDLDNYDKADRYISKLNKDFPEIEVIGKAAGPTTNVSTIRLRRKQ